MIWLFSAFLLKTPAGPFAFILKPCLPLHSKRSLQVQFRRWNFPSKHKPAYKNDRLVNRIKELWERNLNQKEMLRILNEEDGFDIRARELIRVRARHRWLLRVPSGENQLSGMLVGQANDSVEDLSIDATPTTSASTVNLAANGAKKRKRRASGAATDHSRFPSSMTLDDARMILKLDQQAYRDMRIAFQQICREEGVSKKTVAGAEKWEAVKVRLVRQSTPLQAVMWSTREDDAPRHELALDIICTDVTKRARTLESRMTLAEARNLLGVNPQQAWDIRTAFQKVLAGGELGCKSDASAEQWQDMRRRWGEQSPLVKTILEDIEPGDDDKTGKSRALDVLAMDITKRMRDDRSRTSRGRRVPLSPGVSSYDGQHRSPSTDPGDYGDGLARSNLDNISEVSRASNIVFSPANSNMGGHLQEGLPPTPRMLGTSMTPSMGLQSPVSSSLLLGPGPSHSQGTFMEQSYAPQQFDATGATTSAPVFTGVETMSPACAVYMRLHPGSSFVTSAHLWVATLHSHSVQELRQAAADKFPGTICVRVEGMLKDGKRGELPLPIEQDQELSAYLAHLQGMAPTFTVQLMWKS